MKSIRNVDVLYTIHEKSRVLEECICRVESACDTGHFESVDSALRTKPELRAALGTYIRQLLALLGMLTPQAYSTASLDVRDVQDLLQALQWEPDKASAFWPDLCDACRTLYRLSGEQLDMRIIRKLQMISTALPKLMWIKMFCELMRTGRKNVLIVNIHCSFFWRRQLR